MIFVIKTVDGAEIVGKISKEDVESTDQSLRIDNPMEIRYRTTEDGRPAATLMKYNYFGGGTSVFVNRTAIITAYTIAPEFAKLYEDSFERVEREVKESRQSINPEQPKKTMDEDPLMAIVQRFTSNTTLH